MRKPEIRAAPAKLDPLWYKSAIIYEVPVRAFFDSNADGIGDFRGLTQKLDYLQDLGVTALWLLPFYPSPLRDDALPPARGRGEPGPEARVAHAAPVRHLGFATTRRVDCRPSTVDY